MISKCENVFLESVNSECIFYYEVRLVPAFKPEIGLTKN